MHVMDRSAKQLKPSSVQKVPRSYAKPDPTTFSSFSQTSTLAREGFDAVDIKGHLSSLRVSSLQQSGSAYVRSSRGLNKLNLVMRDTANACDLYF